MAETLLDIRGLKTWFKTDDGMVRAVDGVDLHIDRGETVGVVGESGCGKTVTARSVLKLIDMPPGRFEAGQIFWQGRDLIPLDQDEMNKVRAREIAIVFQEPMTSLNPVYTIGDQITEVIRLHEGLSRRAAPRARFRCTTSISAIWSPTRCTGFSAESASWKIIEILAPR